MGTPLLLLILGTAIALGQTTGAIDDLEHRAFAAVESIRRAETWNQVLSSRGAVRARLEKSLNLSQPGPDSPRGTFLYLPKATAAAMPAVLLLRPHADPTAREFTILPAALAQMGVLVLELDIGTHHSRFNLLADGFLPQSLVQRDVRASIAYLKTRTDVDMKRLGLIGQGLTATVGAAINTEFSTVVLLDGAPDYRSIIERLRLLRAPEAFDSCHLLPGILRYAATEELLSLIAPRPLLLLDPANRPLEYITEVYRGGIGVDKLQHRPEKDWTVSARFATYSWLGLWLANKVDLTDFREPVKWPKPIIVNLEPLAVTASVSRASVTAALLTSLLGDPLPEGSMTYALNCRKDQRVDFYPQAGLKIPATALRPGLDACGSSRGTLIAVDDRGRSALAESAIVQEAVRRNWLVWMVDPRGIGELKTSLEPFVFATSLLLGENFTWRQSADILRVLRRVAGMGSQYPTALYARGKNMSVAAMYVAAVADKRELQWVVLEDAAVSFRGMTAFTLSALPFDVLKSFDITDLLNAAQTRPLVISNPEEFLQRDW